MTYRRHHANTLNRSGARSIRQRHYRITAGYLQQRRPWLAVQSGRPSLCSLNRWDGATGGARPYAFKPRAHAEGCAQIS